MFRAQQNAFDDVIVKATDENLTSENWELIMAVVDKVSESPTGAKDAVAALIKRLAHRNANVQLYTLELANALSQNCGPNMHKELASRSFTDALLRLAGDRNTHQQVKGKIVERMGEWSEMFGKDADLGIMEQAFGRLRMTNPGLSAPSKPGKRELSLQDRKREEEELQMALALSMKENAGGKAATPATASSNAAKAQHASTGAQGEATQQQQQPGTTAATVSRVRALFDFTPSEPGELKFNKGDIIAVLESVYKDWWKGSLKGQTGIFPLNYVEKLQDPTREELEKEAQMESEVFNQIGNVEKLLALLSTNDSGRGGADNEEITELYHTTLAIRPKLIELIGKYSQKKDDMTQLNERFIKARRDYEALLEASMSHPPQQQYGRPAYAYNQPPPQQNFGAGGGYGTAPPVGYQQQQVDPRFQSPAPQDQYVPQNGGPQPFHFVPGGAPPQQAQGQPPRTNSTVAAQAGRSTDDLYTTSTTRVNAQNDPRRQTIAFGSGQHQVGVPQELATGSFDSPVDGRHDSVGAAAQTTNYYDAYNPSKASDPYAAAPSAPLGQEGGYVPGGARPPIPGAVASLPSQQRPSAPPTQSSSSPVYPGLGGAGAGTNPYGNGGQYQAYNPSTTSVATGYPTGAGSRVGAGEDFYRS